MVAVRHVDMKLQGTQSFYLIIESHSVFLEIRNTQKRKMFAKRVIL